MKKNLMGLALSAAFAGALTLGTPSAQALQITQVQAGGNLVDTSFSGGEELAVDFGFLTDAPVSVHFTLDGSETQLRFSAVVKELRSARTVTELLLDFGGLAVQPGASLDLDLQPADVHPYPGTLSFFAVTPGHDGTETSELYLGDPFLRGDQPWLVSVAGQGAGRSFTLTVSAVPEPQTWGLMLLGLAALPAARRALRQPR